MRTRRTSTVRCSSPSPHPPPNAPPPTRRTRTSTCSVRSPPGSATTGSTRAAANSRPFSPCCSPHPGRPLTAARLAEGIFDEDNPPARPKSVLAAHAYRLRRTLRNHHADHLLVTVDGGYRLDVPAESLDSVAFDRLVARAEDLRVAADRPRARDLLARALALHEGEPLTGLPGGHAVELLRHLAERRVAVLEAKLALDVDLGDNPSCLVELDQAVFAHPFRERFRALLMLEYHLADRPAEARAAYADARAGQQTGGFEAVEDRHADVHHDDVGSYLAGEVDPPSVRLRTESTTVKPPRRSESHGSSWTAVAP